MKLTRLTSSTAYDMDGFGCGLATPIVVKTGCFPELRE